MSRNGVAVLVKPECVIDLLVGRGVREGVFRFRIARHVQGIGRLDEVGDGGPAAPSSVL